jgi:hypothetical protein
MSPEINPVYGTDGNYRGNTKEGFTGVPIIYDGEQNFENMKASELSQTGGLYLDQISFKDGSIRDAIETHIVNADVNDGLSASEIITIKSADIGDELYNAKEAKLGNMVILRGRDNDSASSNADTFFEPSVENIRNVILSHEINHTQLGLNLSGGDKNHRQISMDQMLHPQFAKTTERFQQYNALQYGYKYGGDPKNLPTIKLQKQFSRIYPRFQEYYYDKGFKSLRDVYNGN